jgi:hypothetical protein
VGVASARYLSDLSVSVVRFSCRGSAIGAMRGQDATLDKCLINCLIWDRAGHGLSHSEQFSHRGFNSSGWRGVCEGVRDMQSGRGYRCVADVCVSLANTSPNPKTRAEFYALAKFNLRLAEQAERNKLRDLSVAAGSKQASTRRRLVAHGLGKLGRLKWPRPRSSGSDRA